MSSTSRLPKYFFVGAIACASNFLTLTALVKFLGVIKLFASGAAFVVGSLVNYILQYHWTFKARQPHGKALFVYACVTACTAALNVILFDIFLHFGVWYVVAQGLAMTLVVPINYTVNRRYTFVG